MKFFIKTYGCAHNQADSEFMAGLLCEAGHMQIHEQKEADLVIINTCTVKDPSEKKFFSELKRIKKPVIVAGCIPQADAEKLEGYSLIGVRAITRIIEAAENKGGTFRSTDRGESWTKMSSYVARSPQYYNEIFVDPIDENKIYSMDTYSQYSLDGGKTWKRFSLKSRHVDDHALWVNPDNTEHLLIGGDGGLYESFDGGKNFYYKQNLPLSQFYRVEVDNSKPFYYVYGGTQDNNSVGGPSQTFDNNGIVNTDWFITHGGDGFEPQIDPENPNIVYTQSQYGWVGG